MILIFLFTKEPPLSHPPTPMSGQVIVFQAFGFIDQVIHLSFCKVRVLKYCYGSIRILPLEPCLTLSLILFTMPDNKSFFELRGQSEQEGLARVPNLSLLEKGKRIYCPQHKANVVSLNRTLTSYLRNSYSAA